LAERTEGDLPRRRPALHGAGTAGLPIGTSGVICLAEQALLLTAVAQSILAWLI
jgi:hypothetical protein